MSKNNKKSNEIAFICRYDEIISRLRTWVVQEDVLNPALVYANLYGEIRAANHDGVYADVEIELHLVSLAMKSGLIDRKTISDQRGNGVLVLTTELYDYGGHTKVLLAWLKLMKEVLPHKLIITRAVTERVEKIIRDLSIEIIRTSGSDMNSIIRIIESAKGFNRIVLHTHPQDIISIIAARILSTAGYDLIFYNHADHIFSFGIGAANTVCEVSAYGQSINQRTKRVNGTAIKLGIPLRCLDLSTVTMPTGMQSLDGYKVIVSSGSSYKYKPDDKFIFAAFIDELLNGRSDVKVVLVGPTGKETWWKDIRDKWSERVLFFGTLPESEYMKLLKVADIYVDSYPITGGTAFPEALLAGKACIGLTPPVQGYTLADELRVESVDQMLAQATKILNKDFELLQYLEIMRVRVAKTQSEAAFKARICKIYTNSKQDLVCDNNYSQNGIDSLWLEEQWRSSCVIKYNRRAISTLPIRRLIWLMWKILSKR